MQHELFERLASLRDHQQPDGRSTGGERFLDRAATGNELLVRAQQIGSRKGGGRPGPVTGLVSRPWAATVGSGAGSVRRTARVIGRAVTTAATIVANERRTGPVAARWEAGTGRTRSGPRPSRWPTASIERRSATIERPIALRERVAAFRRSVSPGSVGHIVIAIPVLSIVKRPRPTLLGPRRERAKTRSTWSTSRSTWPASGPTRPSTGRSRPGGAGTVWPLPRAVGSRTIGSRPLGSEVRASRSARPAPAGSAPARPTRATSAGTTRSATTGRPVPPVVVAARSVSH